MSSIQLDFFAPAWLTYLRSLPNFIEGPKTHRLPWRVAWPDERIGTFVGNLSTDENMCGYVVLLLIGKDVFAFHPFHLFPVIDKGENHE